jgi:hypothetical protein
MPATKSDKGAKSVTAAGYSYGEVETALARVLQVDADGQTGWLRGRIQHLRRLGFTPPADRGAPVAYTFEWATRWLLALRLERVGLNPVAVVEFFEANWVRKPGHKWPVTSLQEVIDDARVAQHHQDDVWLVITFDNFNPDAFPKIGRIRPYRKPHPKSDNAQVFFDASREDVADMVAIPLTEILRLLDAALKKVPTSA